jgi:hypothetical protein
MATKGGPNIITDGLVLALDAASPRSYPGTGTTWYDLSEQGNNGTITNSPTFSDNTFIFNGTTQYAQANSVTNNIISSDFTLEAWIKTSSTQDHKSIFSFNTSGGGNRKLWMVRNAGMGVYDSTTWYIGSINVDDNQWHHIMATYDYSTKGLKTYTDGVLDLNVTTNVQINVQASDTANIAMEYDAGSPSDYFYGEIPIVKVYDKVLSSTEVTQNYNALKSRFELS